MSFNDLLFSIVRRPHGAAIEEGVRGSFKQAGVGFLCFPPPVFNLYTFLSLMEQNTSRVAEGLADIQNIMRQNLEEVLNRGEKLERELGGRSVLNFLLSRAAGAADLILHFFSGPQMCRRFHLA